VHTFIAHAQERLFTSFLSKIWLNYTLRRSRDPTKQTYFHHRVTFTGYIRYFRDTDLVTLTSDLFTLRVRVCDYREKKNHTVYSALYKPTQKQQKSNVLKATKNKSMEKAKNCGDRFTGFWSPNTWFCRASNEISFSSFCLCSSIRLQPTPRTDFYGIYVKWRRSWYGYAFWWSHDNILYLDP